jgi:hypothetical protein
MGIHEHIKPVLGIPSFKLSMYRSSRLKFELYFVRIPAHSPFYVCMDFRIGRIPLCTYPDVRPVEELVTGPRSLLVRKSVEAVPTVA